MDTDDLYTNEYTADGEAEPGQCGRGARGGAHVVGQVGGESGALEGGGLDEPPGVNEQELLRAPEAAHVEPVARHAGGVVHDGGVGAAEPVEERRLAHVGPPDHRHARQHVHRDLRPRRKQTLGFTGKVGGEGARCSKGGSLGCGGEA